MMLTNIIIVRVCIFSYEQIFPSLSPPSPEKELKQPLVRSGVRENTRRDDPVQRLRCTEVLVPSRNFSFQMGARLDKL